MQGKIMTEVTDILKMWHSSDIYRNNDNKSKPDLGEN
jgi:hypothetical protein